MENFDIRLKFNELKIKFYSVSSMVNEIAKKDYLCGGGKFQNYRKLEKYLEDLLDELFKIMDDN